MTAVYVLYTKINPLVLERSLSYLHDDNFLKKSKEFINLSLF